MSPEASAVPLKRSGIASHHPNLQSPGCVIVIPFADEPTCRFVDTIQEDVPSKPLLIKQY